jgi:positive regulator of sigma E activity
LIKLASISEINEKAVKLKLNSDTNCEDCKSRCSDGFLDFLFNKKYKNELIVIKQNNQNHGQIRDKKGFFNSHKKVGDKVGLQFSDKDLMFLSTKLYAIPILIILVLMPLSYGLGETMNINADLCGFFGFILALTISKIALLKNKSRINLNIDFFQ